MKILSGLDSICELFRWGGKMRGLRSVILSIAMSSSTAFAQEFSSQDFIEPSRHIRIAASIAPTVDTEPCIRAALASATASFKARGINVKATLIRASYSVRLKTTALFFVEQPQLAWLVPTFAAGSTQCTALSALAIDLEDLSIIGGVSIHNMRDDEPIIWDTPTDRI